MDFCDEAAEKEAKFFKWALKRHLRRTRAVPIAASQTHCDECDDEIPVGRRTAIPGVRLCIHCQAAEEKR